MTTAARHRAPARHLGRWALPSFIAFIAWLAEDTPDGTGGFALVVLTGLLVSLFYPLAVLMALEAPGALVPADWRSRWRRGEAGRPHIPDRLRRTVYAADRHACAYCRHLGNPALAASHDLQLDHVKPWSVGGRTSFFNSMTLCGYHNRIKSNCWMFKNGRRTYKGFNGYANWDAAYDILEFELRHRWSLVRLARAALAL